MSSPQWGAEQYLASPLARFRPWAYEGRSPQQEFLRASARGTSKILRSGNQCGKTTACAFDVVARCMGVHPYVRQPPPLWGWCSALDWEFGVGQVMWPKVKQFLPMRQVRSINYYRKRDPDIAESVIFCNGSRIDFKSADAGREKYQGAALNFAWVDEEHEGNVIEEIRARLLRHGGELLCSLTPVARKRWVLELEREPGTTIVRASTLDAARAGILDLRAVQRYADALPDRQRAVRIDGDFAALEGLVYPEFARATHVLRPSAGHLCAADGTAIFPWPLPAAWPRYAAIDFGYANPTAVVVAAMAPDGELIVERCYYAPFRRMAEWGAFLKQRLRPLAAPLVADHDAMDRAELTYQGVPTAAAVKDIIPGLEAVERAMHRAPETGRPRLFLAVDDENTPRTEMTGRCDAHYLCWELEAYRYPKRAEYDTTGADKKDAPIKRDDHACDALRYMLYFIEKNIRTQRTLGDLLAPAGAPAACGPDEDDEPADGWGPRRRATLR